MAEWDMQASGPAGVHLRLLPHVKSVPQIEELS